ncbi:MAG: carboxypeptidase-like regulatory domain-containing protein [Gracilimonas sp.]|uniref:carboxypeptidase-like regulatory domain-containing protein n=1 Tax=Gracilimonas sp. TaxID=1974203 RepID=UPI00374FFD0F|nr:carboxypeptidase-like regulatory domain-containing protein [Gracilimonas sp.]
MNRRLVLFFLLMLPFSAIAQTVKGKVYTESTVQDPLAFVNIGIIGTTVGTVSDEEGYFTLPFRKEHLNKQVRFSIIGYKSKEYKLDNLLNQFNEIKMEKDTVQLNKIVVTDFRLKKKDKGTKTSSKRIVTGWNRYILGGERGIRIKVGSKPISVKSLHFHVANNGFKKVLLRLHFRNFKDGVPFRHVVNSDIIIPVNIKSGWVNVDLEEYDLVFEEDVAVTLQPVHRTGECLEQENCFHLSLGMFRIFSPNWLVYKISSEADWEIKKIYSPGIYLSVYE